MIDNLVILGAGNAGLISALMLKTAFPNLSISVIKSEKISTIGVGEGSNEHWLEFSKVVGISTADVLRETDATFKHGIKFVNWHGDDNVYYHSLPEYLSVQDHYTGLPYTLMRLVSENTPPEKLVWAACLDGKVPSDLDFDFAQFHFNTFKLNNFLLKKCILKNINIVNCEINDIILNEKGEIDYLKTTDKDYKADFFIDCTGFKKLLIAKLGAKWKSYKNFLKMKEAIAFPTEDTENYNTYTLAQAMKYGWLFRIPVYGRWGNGYIFDNDYINADAILPRLQSLTQSTECYWFKIPSTSIKDSFVPCVFQLTQYRPIGNFTTGGSTTESISILTNSITAYYEQGSRYYFDDTWHCAHYVFGTNFNKLYLDGVELSLRYQSGTASTGLGTAYTTATNCSIANRSTDLYGGEGEIALVQFFDRAFTATEVLAHYNNYKNRFTL